MMRDRGDKEIRFECGLAVVGCDRSEWPNRKFEFDLLTPSGRFAKPFSGTWQAENDSTVKTFADLLQRTLEKRVADSWHSGGPAGNWWLKGSPP